MTFGEKLRQLRHDRNFTQAEIGNLVGKTSATICDWEKGKASPNLQELVILAEFFQVTTDYMLGRVVAYAPFQKLVNTWWSDRDHVSAITLIKKFTPSNYATLDRLIEHFIMSSEGNTDLLTEIFHSVGYRVDTAPVSLDEWEMPEWELAEQKESRLLDEKAKKQAAIRQKKRK